MDRASAPKTDTASPSESAPPASAGSAILSRVVGEISDRIVTSREVQLNDALEQALEAAPKGKMRVITGREMSFSRDVTRVLREWAVFFEAQTFSQAALPKAEASKRSKAALELWASRADWNKLEPTEAEIREQLERKLVAREFIRIKSEASQAPVTDADALTYFKKNRLKFGNLPFDEFRDNIKAFLARQQSERRLKEWFEVLERKYRARNFISG